MDFSNFANQAIAEDSAEGFSTLGVALVRDGVWMAIAANYKVPSNSNNPLSWVTQINRFGKYLGFGQGFAQLLFSSLLDLLTQQV